MEAPHEDSFVRKVFQGQLGLLAVLVLAVSCGRTLEDHGRIVAQLEAELAVVEARLARVDWHLMEPGALPEAAQLAIRDVLDSDRQTTALALHIFIPVQDGHYLVLWRRPEHRDVHASVRALRTGPNKWTIQTVRLFGGGMLLVRVRDEEGRPLAQKGVRILESTFVVTGDGTVRLPVERSMRAVTDEHGNARLFQVRPGQYDVYEVTAEAPPVLAVVTEGETTEVVLTVEGT